MPPLITFQESDVEILAKIRREANKRLNIILQRTVKPITILVKSELGRAISEQPEYSSIIRGKLRFEFGIPDGISRLSQIVDIWLAGVTVVVKNNGAFATPMMTIEIRAVESSYSDVLSHPASSLTTLKGDVLEWLSWLLLEGNNPAIVANYHVSSGKGRAGPFIMRLGGNWGVPSIFQGDRNDNFVIRAIKQIEPILEKSIINIIRKRINA